MDRKRIEQEPQDELYTMTGQGEMEMQESSEVKFRDVYGDYLQQLSSIYFAHPLLLLLYYTY